MTHVIKLLQVKYIIILTPSRVKSLTVNIFKREEWEINDKNNLKTMALPGDKLIKMIEAMANPHRLKIIALLTGRRIHVSQLAREVMISRPLLYMHLKRLENAGLVTSKLELSDNGKAMNYYEVKPFALYLSPENITKAVKTLTINKSRDTASDVNNQKEDDNE